LEVVALPPQIAGLSNWRALARGGFATVWEARQDSLNRRVAVKVDQRTLETDSEQRRFLREAGAAGRMSGHPGIVTVHDAGILSDERPFLVMELCPGGSLTSWLKPENRPSQQRVRDVGVRIADALAAAHARGVLHRDVKPANILIDSYDNPGLADFGLAIIPEPDAELAEALEALTPAYAAPEVLDRQAATEFGDVYSLAATLYALLCGHSPRPAEGEVTTRVQVDALLRKPIERLPDVAPELMDVLMDAMADDPTTRPSAATFRDRLRAARLPATDGPSPAEPAKLAVPLARPTRSRARLVLLSVLLVAVIIAAVAALVRLGPSRVAAAPSPSASVAHSTSPSTSPSPSPTPTLPVASGFADCSARLGPGAMCRTSPECWGGIFSYADSPFQGTPQTCAKLHVYQTFAATELATSPRRQTKINASVRIKTLCTRSKLNKMLVGAVAAPGWEIYAIPPQFASDTVYRCIFANGERVGPYALLPPS
jgi:serine/threonine protein kinase